MKNTYLIFVIQCFDEYQAEIDRLTNNVIVEIIAKDVDSAISKAKKIVTGKKGYRLSRVIEKEHGT